MTKPAATELIGSYQLDDAWHIASLIIHCAAPSLCNNKAWLQSWPGLEIHGEDNQGKLVVVLESTEPQTILDFIDSCHQQPGIINAALVYHEILASEEEPTP